MTRAMFPSISELDYFRMLVSDPDSIPLFEAAASIGKDASPTLDLQDTQARFDEHAARLSLACRGASTETARLSKLLQFFFVTERFAGNVDDYYSPDNSYLHRVLQTRKGIPITLAVLLCELGGHVGLELSGIAFPGHFLVRANLHEGIAIIDPFSGQSLDQRALELRAAPYGLSREKLLQPASARQILIRMLSNLHAIYTQQGRNDLLEKTNARLDILQSGN